MNLSETARLTIELVLKGNFAKAIKGAKSDLAGMSTGTRRAVTQVKGMSGALGGMTTKLKGLGAQAKGSILQGVGLGVGVGGFQLLTQAAGAAIGAIGDSIGAASDLAESQSKVGAVFKETSREVLDWADDLDSAYGISTRAALEAAGTFGNFLQAMGSTERAANDMSTSIVELAGDLASFNNVAREDVLLALRSGLAGESEPVRRLGIDISAARIEALLLANGIEKVGKEFTQAQKVQGRYLAIMQDTKTAQGDAVRTAGEFAGKQRQLDVATAKLSTTFGGFVIGPATDFLGFLVDLLDTSPKVSDRVAALNERFEDTQKAIEGAAKAAGVMADEWKPLTELDIDPIFRTGIYSDLAPELLEYANRLRLSREELRQLIYTHDDATGSVRELLPFLKEEEGAWTAYAISTAGAGTQTVKAAESMERATLSGVGLADAFQAFTGRAIAAANAVSSEAQALQDFKDVADQVGETRSLGQINRALARQAKLLDEAAEANNVKAFAAAQARITELEAEKAIRKSARQSLNAHNRRTKREKKNQGEVTQAVKDTTTAARVLGRVDPKITVTTPGLASANERLRTAIGLAGGLASGARVDTKGSNGIARFHSGTDYVPRTGLAVLQKGEAVIPRDRNQRGMGGDVYVRVDAAVVATQVESQTSRTVRQNRYRANT